MKTWIKNEDGQYIFNGGRDNEQPAAITAENCRGFVRDVEEECVTETTVSCYNCRYRRWTETAFICMKGVEYN